MILYTVMPEELIYPVDHSQLDQQKVVNINGVEMLVSVGSEYDYSILRVLSTNPEHFLLYEPGQKISVQQKEGFSL
ncbi:YlzJ-like family protein [Bacillus manliponensis]|uniref:YlzJ-like family protein n=1 Tax=Bacillus manliponensis TaxID=574376 RepID=UPI003511D044